MTRTIYIQDFFPSIITTRSSISIFKNEMNIVDGVSYTFDFTNIHFISRAFADELYKFIKAEALDTKFCHANANILAIYGAVKKSTENPRKNYEQIPITRFKSDDELFEFLSII